jgi:hypothetical protein
MTSRFTPALGAFLTLFVLYLVGVLFFYAPIEAADSPGEPLVHGLLGHLITTALFVALFVWVTREMGNPLKAALAVALAQFLLVDVDYVLSGKRGIETAAASAVLLFVSWTITGWVYRKIDRTPALPVTRMARLTPPDRN